MRHIILLIAYTRARVANQTEHLTHATLVLDIEGGQCPYGPSESSPIRPDPYLIPTIWNTD